MSLLAAGIAAGVGALIIYKVQRGRPAAVKKRKRFQRDIYKVVGFRDSIGSLLNAVSGENRRLFEPKAIEVYDHNQGKWTARVMTRLVSEPVIRNPNLAKRLT